VLPGTVIAERFEIERPAGSGGMGDVYRALDRRTGGPVALKILRPEKTAELDRIFQEARIVADLRHPGIVGYVDHGLADGRRYLALEWLTGMDLEARLAGGALDVAEAVELGRCVAEALGAAHARGVVHRDVKPSNLFLVEGRIDRVKVLDFGIARLDGTRDLRAKTGMFLGTPGYVAPEQARGMRSLDARADVFSLGCVLFECLTGKHAFAGEHVVAVLAKILLEEPPRVRSARSRVPAWLDDLVARMLAKDPAMRPRDGGAVAAELGAGGAAPAAVPSIRGRHALTAGEQRLLGVVLAGADLAMGDTVPAGLPAEGGPIAAAVAEHGGVLEQLADGSLVVTIFGDAGIATDLAARAARCALALRALLPDPTPMALCTGRGELVRGVTGEGPGRPLGQAIDRAAHLVRATASPGEPARVRIDEVTAGLLDARFEIGGDARGLLLERERDLTDMTRTLLGKPTPCVGRDREIATLVGLFEESTEEPVARVALVTGPAGVGKSRVRYEVLKRLAGAPSPPEVWLCRGDPMRAGSPFGLVAQALRRAAGIQDGEPLDVRRQKLSARAGRHLAGEAQRRVAEFLGEIVGAPFPDEGRVELRAARGDAMLLGDQMRRAFEDFVEAECAAHPLVVVLEDLQWGDLPSVQFVDALLRRLETRPLLVLAFGRPEVHDGFPRLWSGRGMHEIRLGELTRRAAEKLVHETLGPGVPAADVERLVAHAAGNAFYLEELIRAAAEGRGGALPETVVAMVEARLERLDPDARRVLRAGSVFGQVFWRGGVQALLGGAPDDGALDRLVAREMIARRGESKIAGETEYVFRHALVREAAYAMLTDADARLGHGLAGEWLEAAGERDAVLLAEHFERGGEPRRAVAWYRRGAEQALGGNDLEAAIARAERGLRCGADGEEHGALLLTLAEARRWRGENVEAEQACLSALPLLAPGSAPWLNAAAELALASGRLGHNDHLVGLAVEVLTAPIPEGGLNAAVGTLSRAANQLFFAGRADLGGRLLDRAARLAAEAPRLEPYARARLEDSLGTRLLCEGDPAGALVHAEAAVALSEQAGDLRMACLYRSDLGFLTIEVGAHDHAERVLREALAAAERMGLDYIVAAARSNLGTALARRGALAEARAVEEQALEAFRAQGNRRMEGASLIYLALILEAQGDLPAAERAATGALAALETSPPAACHALAALASIELALGRTAAAIAHADRAAASLADLGGIDEGEALVRLVHAEARRAAGDAAGAEEALAAARARLLERAERIKDPAWRRSFLDRVPENARTMRGAP
jgi:tetratricopeptide (TPR) repeat protein